MTKKEKQIYKEVVITPGEWELYEATRSVLQGLVEPDYYLIKCNQKTIADKIESRADAQLLLTSKKMLEKLIKAEKSIEKFMKSAGYNQQDIDGYLFQHRELIKKATEI